MDKNKCYSFSRYSKTFQAVKVNCSCGGKYDCVDLTNSDRNLLVVMCNNQDCSLIAFAPRISDGPAFEGAPLPRNLCVV